MASIIKVDTIQSTTANVFFQNSAGTEYARFNSSGYMGIGTNSPSFPLTVSGVGDTQIFLTSTGTNASGQFIANGNGAGSYPAYNLYQSGTNYWSFMMRGDTNLYLQRQGGTGNTILSDGTFKTPSTISVGNATPSSSGAGITFPATQSASSDANTLDDYEEGTWTPVIIGTSTAGTGTYSVQNGRYTKIGNRVYFGVYCVWSAHTGTGDMTMGGLPFTSSGSNFTGVSIRYSNLTCSTGYICTPIVADNRSDIVFQQSAVGAAASALGQALDVSADVIMAGHYFIT